MDIIRRTKPEKTGIRAPLGELEQSVMRYVWACGEAGCLAVEVQKALEVERSLALTTVLTTLDRLHDKEILTREKEGKAYRYHSAVSEETLHERIVAGVLGDLLAQFPKAVAAYFAQQGMTPVARQQEEQAERLAELARRLETMENTSLSPDIEEETRNGS